MFIPFVCDVRVGSDPHFPIGGPSLDLDDTLIGSPPVEGAKLTPPSSPHVGGADGTTLQTGAKER